jgi:Holliday junction DNA helicase RuvB
VTRIQTPDLLPEEDELDRSLRPRSLADFVGQEPLKDQLAVSLEAAAARGEALDHVLLAGPPGLGKTSLAQILAEELGVPFVATAAPALERKGDIAALLTALEPRSVFFVDEIHRLSRALEETFYPAMEDRRLPITVGQGAGAKVVTLELPPFTLVGATTRAGRLTTPLRDRFGIQHRLEPYGPRDLAAIVRRSAAILDVQLAGAGAEAIAARSRGTPRVANRLLKRVRDFAQVRADGVVTEDVARAALDLLQVDHLGPGPAGPRDPLRGLPEVRRRPRRARDARGHRGGGDGHPRGRLRALPAAVRAAQADPARTRRDAPRLRAPRARAALRASTVLRPAPIRPPSGLHATRNPSLYPQDGRWLITSSVPTAATAPQTPSAPPASGPSPRAARSAASASCSSCSTTTTRRRTPRSSPATRPGRSSPAAAGRSS